jgi:hypothetical protein
MVKIVVLDKKSFLQSKTIPSKKHTFKGTNEDGK